MEKKEKIDFGFTPVYIKNFRRGLATNSSSTHSLIYRNEGELFKDLDIFELDYYGRCDSTIAASREAKIKYVLAAIMWNEPLVRIMSAIYPEMKQYFVKIKEAFADDEYDSEKFGMYCRGCLDFTGNIEASVDYLRNVIDNKDIVIIGGSDEMNFVYDTIRDHVLCPEPDMVRYGSRSSHYGVTKNGNYWIGYGDTNDEIITSDDEREWYDNKPIKDSFCGRIRFATSTDEIVPEFPELIDLKITDKCDNGCPFCFQDSKMSGKDADFWFLKVRVVHACGDANETRKHRVEFSIGGGSVILYPHLEELLMEIHKNGHIANVTINVKDCERIMNDEELASIFKNYVDGIVVSIFTVDDVETLAKFYDFFNTDKYAHMSNYKHIVAHLIPEMIGVERTKDIFTAIRDEDDLWCTKLFLGYKTNGRGANVDVKEFTKDDLDRLFDESSSYVSIDTTFANRYFWYIKDKFAYEKSITLNEGEFSMYIDGVEENAYKSSYQTEKPYNMRVKCDENGNRPEYYDLKEAFTEIRRDGGFKVYEAVKRHYYDDAKHYWEED